jgi:uncharacterized protein GlcG (DUF336 family)
MLGNAIRSLGDLLMKIVGLRAALLGTVVVGPLASFAAEPATPPASVAPAARPSTPEELPLAAAVDWAQTAVASCKANGYSVAATYMDTNKNVKVALRADGAGGGSVDTGRRKAYTAIASGMNSADYAASKGVLPGMPLPALPGKPRGVPEGVDDFNMIAGSGGVLVKNAAGKLLGAVSVAGAPGAEKDLACLQAGLDKIQSALK